MSSEHVDETDPRMQNAVDELKAMIQQHWPTAGFTVCHGEDPEGSIYLDATVDLDDPDVVLDVVIDRLLELQVDEGLPIHVVPLRTPERAAALGKHQRQRKPYPSSALETLLHPIL